MFGSRLRASFAGANPRVCAAFWLFGAVVSTVIDGKMFAMLTSGSRQV